MRYGVISVPATLVADKPPKFISGEAVAGEAHVGGKFKDAFYTY